MTGEDETVFDKKKPHRERHAGRKAEKKKNKREKSDLGTSLRDAPNKDRNPKAFALNSAVRAERRFRRGQDILTKKQHIPLVDRTPLEPPPILIAVVGPAKVGKTTLINCLIKNFTRQPLTEIKGPVTIVSGKKRRLTIIECNNDINCMIDLAKVADLVLLLVDASFGFEMEIFEFLNICQVHGMPRVMGVLTHLDMIKKSEQLKRTKKTLKHRFWTEVYAGAKLFYLSGQVHGEYLRNEVKNLGRFISVMKFRPLTWRSTHPYMIADRLEDVTPPEDIRQNAKADRSVCLYGYMRGTPLNRNSMVHVSGCGDFQVADVSFLPDPCPLPSKEKEKKRSLIEREKYIYAPFSGVGGIVYDKDAVYVDLGGSHSHSYKDENDHRQAQRDLVSTLLQTQKTVDVKMQHSEVQLFSNAAPITADDIDQQQRNYQYQVVTDNTGRKRRKVVFPVSNIEGADEKEDSSEDSGSEASSISGDIDQADESEDDIKKKFDMENNTDSDDSKVEEESENEVENEEDCTSNSDESGVDEYINDESNSGSEEEYNMEQGCSSKGSIKTDKCHLSVSNVKYGTSRKSILKGKLDDSDEDNFESINVEPLKKKEKNSSSTVMENDVGPDNPTNSNYSLNKKGKISCSKETNEYQKLCSETGSDIRSKISGALSFLERSRSSEEVIQDIDDEEQWSTYSKEIEEGVDSETDSHGELSEKSERTHHTRDHVSVNKSVNMFDSEDKAFEESVRWKTNLKQKAADAFITRQASTQNLWKLVYGKVKELEKPNEHLDEEGQVGGLFRKVSHKQHQHQEARSKCNSEDCSRFPVTLVRDWSNPEVRDLIRDCFVTGKYKESEDAEELLKLDGASDEDEEMFGDFEDLETGEKFKSSNPSGFDSKEDKGPEDKERSKPLSKKEIMEKKLKLKEKFDTEYDEKDGGKSYYDELKAEVDKQAQLNRSEFDGLDDDVRVQLEGFRAGMYVRVEITQVPYELVQHFDPTYPLIIGGLLAGEENIGYVQVRMKKHRWYKRILKTRDPLILSLGWRRFQTLPIYSKLEDNMRNRMLKYTPEHVSCMGHFWGPITPQGTGFLAVQDVASKSPEFRIAATGVVVEQDKSTQITKKLKLTGVPYKIYKKTAFIKDMFTSTLEVARFEGAKIKTVSGIRGQIKKACSKPEGCFRATFEDTILLSDIVFCRTWYKVDVPQLYNPVTSLLLSPELKHHWRGMKTTGQLKRERDIKNEAQIDSMYTPVERAPVSFKPLSIPRSLQKELPYRDKPKLRKESSKSIQSQRVAVVREPHEQKVDKLMTMLKTAYNHKQQQLKKATHERIEALQKEKELEEQQKLHRQKALKKDVYKSLSRVQSSGKRKRN